VSKSRVLGLVASVSLLLALFVVLPGMGADEREKEKRDTLYRPVTRTETSVTVAV